MGALGAGRRGHGMVGVSFCLLTDSFVFIQYAEVQDAV